MTVSPLHGSLSLVGKKVHATRWQAESHTVGEVCLLSYLYQFFLFFFYVHTSSYSQKVPGKQCLLYNFVAAFGELVIVVDGFARNNGIGIHVYDLVCIHVCVCVYVCVCACARACVRACVCVCMCVLVHMCVLFSGCSPCIGPLAWVT
jgi:hypothetical protein